MHGRARRNHDRPLRPSTLLTLRKPKPRLTDTAGQSLTALDRPLLSRGLVGWLIAACLTGPVTSEFALCLFPVLPSAAFWTAFPAFYASRWQGCPAKAALNVSSKVLNVNGF